MRGAFVSSAVLSFATLLVGGVAVASPVTLERDEARLAPSDTTRVIYRKLGATVLRAADAADADFRDVYVVNTYNHFVPPAGVEEEGELLAFDPGNFAVMRLTPRAAASVASQLHGRGFACGILTKLDGSAIELRAAATPTPLLPLDSRDARVTAVAERIDAEKIRGTINELIAMGTRYYQSESGRGVAEALAAKYRALAGGRADVQVMTYDHGTSSPQPSLLVRITGRSRPSEVLILGSHIDSINMPWSFLSPATPAPGADDNASGTATNLEVFRALMEGGVVLERTLEIHGYAAEEIGLVGSADMAADYKAQNVDVEAMLQFDMTAYKGAGTPDKIWFITDNTLPAFNAQLGQLVTAYTGMPFATASLPQGSSDHASWHGKGYAASFPFENPSDHNGHIHTANDTMQNATAFTLAAGFGKLGVAYAMHFGGIE